MIEPGHLADTSQRIYSRHRGTVQVVVFCDCWDSASFEEEHQEDLRAHERNGLRLLFVLVGATEKRVVLLPVELGLSIQRMKVSPNRSTRPILPPKRDTLQLSRPPALVPQVGND